MRPVTCMITDRTRLTDESGLDRLSAVVARVAMAAKAGVHLVQLRERDLEGGALLALSRRCVDAVRGTSTRILVNDRLDVALAAGAHGVHLRAGSMPASRVRAMAPSGFLVGRSVHRLEDATQTAAGGGVDYLIFGPVFTTVSKPGMAPAGLDMLAAVSAATTLPVLAVGGVTPAAASLVTAAGAAGWAAIGVFAEATDDQLRAALQGS